MSAPSQATTRYEAVIGIEVHVELSTATKMFCGCATDFGGEPNIRTCPVCLGHPGSLPVANAKAVEYALRLGLALGCSIAPWSEFHRKNYFYPDMPKNFQISQYDVPLCEGGQLEIPAGDRTKTVGITRVHMEEDTGKSLHVGSSGRIHGADHSLIDYNRAGIPLLEVVSEPDIRSAEEARACLAELRGIVRTLGISDAKLEEGSMRCDANVSLRPVDTAAYGARVEVKNMNSLRSLARALDYEIARQTDRYEAGEGVAHETRHWNEDEGVTSTLRAKEEVFDYRYFPEPDLVPLEPDVDWIESIRAGLPELPGVTRRRLVDAHGLHSEQVATLVEAGLAERFETAVGAGADPREAANWLTNEVTGWATAHGVEPATAPVSGEQLAELAELVSDGTLSTKLARQVLDEVLAGGGSPQEIVKERGLAQISDTHELTGAIDDAIAANPDAAEKVRNGNDKALGPLVGAVMKATQGQANPQLVNDLLRDRLAG